MQPSAVSQTLSQVWTVLDDFGRPMAIMGGLALSAWNRARFTLDVDILIALEAGDVEPIIAALKSAGLRCKNDPLLTRIGDVDLIQLLYEPPETFVDIRVDLMIPQSEFHSGVVQRRVGVTLPTIDQEVFVVSCEDLILLKLLAARVIDRADAAGLLRTNQGTLDIEYLLKWIERLGLQPQLAEIWDEAFPGESPPLRKRAPNNE